MFIVTVGEIAMVHGNEHIGTVEKTKTQTHSVTKKPKQFKVLLINDDFTPMDFVIEVLEKFFGLDEVKAVTIMLQIHNAGRAVCGIFSRDVAETRVVQVNEYSRQRQYPLLCRMQAM